MFRTDGAPHLSNYPKSFKSNLWFTVVFVVPVARGVVSRIVIPLFPRPILGGAGWDVE